MSEKHNWPKKADFHKPATNAVILAIYDFGHIRDLKSLHAHPHFRGQADLMPIYFEADDQKFALEFIINNVNAEPDNKALANVGKRLKSLIGPLDRPIAVRLAGQGWVIEPKVWLDKISAH